MSEPQGTVQEPARIESLRVRNYRVLRDLELKKLTPMSALLGPNGSGKSTVFDVFAFLSECFTVGLRRAWDKRNRFKELRSRGESGPIVIELKYREQPGKPLITYHLAIDETLRGPTVAEEWLRWTRGRGGRPFNFLEFRNGEGNVISGELPEIDDERRVEALESADLLAVNTLGQFASHPRVSALRRFISGWNLSYLTADNTRGVPESGPQERLSQTGDNLPNVIQYLKEQHPERLDTLLEVLASRIPRLERVDADLLADGRLLLQIKDAPFAEPILAKFASDGTLKMLAYLLVLHDPDPAPLVGIEEPENQLHPRLLVDLAEECRQASSRSQLLVSTHSPFFVDGLRPEEVWVLFRGPDGFTNARQVSHMDKVTAFMSEGAQLGDLWMEGYLEVGDPLTSARSDIS